MMEIKAQAQLLMNLNEVDLKIDHLQKELQQIPIREREEELDVLSKKSKVDRAIAEIADLEHKKRILEKEVAETTDRMAEFQKKLPMIKTNKEYQLALKEIDENKKFNKQRDDQTLEIIGQLETLAVTKKEDEEYLHGSTVAFEARKKELESERLKLTDALGELVQIKEGISPKIEARFLAAYQRIRKQKSDAVVTIFGGICQGCHMKISPQMRLDMQKTTTATSLFTCPTCHRILCLPDWTGLTDTNAIMTKVL
ncbi:MAG: hypothetical protein IPJ69_05775 [Deltaproteobacteria bacterium]|nr:MAG: hypothetical protein IPJ69_05775 [Deltaproteobacteria bacterium]